MTLTSQQPQPRLASSARSQGIRLGRAHHAIAAHMIYSNLKGREAVWLQRGNAKGIDRLPVHTVGVQR